jgi:hypothetical protein
MMIMESHFVSIAFTVSGEIPPSEAITLAKLVSVKESRFLSE